MTSIFGPALCRSQVKYRVHKISCLLKDTMNELKFCKVLVMRYYLFHSKLFPPIWIPNMSFGYTAIIVQEMSPEIFLTFDPFSRKLEPIFSEAETFGCKNQADIPKMKQQITGGKLIDFYDRGDHVRPFSQTPKYVDQIFQRPQIC